MDPPEGFVPEEEEAIEWWEGAYSSDGSEGFTTGSEGFGTSDSGTPGDTSDSGTPVPPSAALAVERSYDGELCLADAVAISLGHAQLRLPPRPRVMQEPAGSSAPPLYMETTHKRRLPSKSGGACDLWRSSGGKRGCILEDVPPELVGGRTGFVLARRCGRITRPGEEPTRYVQWDLAMDPRPSPDTSEVTIYHCIPPLIHPTASSSRMGPIPERAERVRREEPTPERPERVRREETHAYANEAETSETESETRAQTIDSTDAEITEPRGEAMIPVMDFGRMIQHARGFWGQKRGREQAEAREPCTLHAVSDSSTEMGAMERPSNRRRAPSAQQGSMGMMLGLAMIAVMHRVNETAATANGALSMRALQTADGQEEPTDHVQLYLSRVWQPESDMICSRHNPFVRTLNMAHPHFALAFALAMLLSVVMFELRGNPYWGAVDYLKYSSGIRAMRAQLYKSRSPIGAFTISHLSHLPWDLGKILCFAACGADGMAHAVLTLFGVIFYSYTIDEDKNKRATDCVSNMLFAAAHLIVVTELPCAVVARLPVGAQQ